MSRAGNAYADTALAFARAFPIGQTITTKEFDEWGIAQHEISPLECSYDHIDKTAPQWQRLLTERNDLRRRINAGAASSAFRETASAAFSVDVDRHGDTYQIRDAANSYELLARRLPSDLARVTSTKRARIERLKGSIDLAQLPDNAQIMVHQLDRHVRLLMKDIHRRLDDFNEEFSIVEDLIKQLGIKPKNGGLSGFLESQEDR